MKRFARLFTTLDRSTRINDKVTALAAYFSDAPPADAIWTVALLSHRRPRRTVSTGLLRKWAAEAAGIPTWLFEESYPVVGDLAETIALVLPPGQRGDYRSLAEWIDFVRNLRELEEDEKKARILEAWRGLDTVERFLFNKLITGGFRVGVSQKLMIRALSKSTGIEENRIAHRLMGDWHPDRISFEELLLTGDPGEDLSKPYPFFLAYAVDGPVAELGETKDWLAERKWDGIRGQLVLRGGAAHIWSRGEELVTAQFPEIAALARLLPGGTVLDGEILPWRDGAPLGFQVLQTRLGRKKVGKRTLESAPVIFMAYDLLELDGRDLREHPLRERRRLLGELLTAHPGGGVLLLSPVVSQPDWEGLARERQRSRELRCEGLMLKRLDSAYGTGRRKGDWWKWKIDPLTIDAVMIYAQRGHGRRANLFTDFTFAVWKTGEELVPFTKAYSGLTDQEFGEITNWVRRNTLERFGPVRLVEPVHVFEIAFEGIRPSTRHKSGVALRFPRIHRWRRDKPPSQADTLDTLLDLMARYGD